MIYSNHQARGVFQSSATCTSSAVTKFHTKRSLNWGGNTEMSSNCAWEQSIVLWSTNKRTSERCSSARATISTADPISSDTNSCSAAIEAIVSSNKTFENVPLFIYFEHLQLLLSAIGRIRKRSAGKCWGPTHSQERPLTNTRALKTSWMRKSALY